MRGSIKIGKEQYQIVATSPHITEIRKKAGNYRERGYKATIRKGRGVASKEYILYVLPKKPKGVR